MPHFITFVLAFILGVVVQASWAPPAQPETAAWNGVPIPYCRPALKGELPIVPHPVCPDAVMKKYQELIRFGYTGMDYGNDIHCTFPAEVKEEYLQRKDI